MPSKVKFMKPHRSQSNFMPSPMLKSTPKLDTIELSKKPSVIELNASTMKDTLTDLSSKCTDQYVSSGYPPKVCTLILKELIQENKLKVKILDIGCGKGHVG